MGKGSDRDEVTQARCATGRVGDLELAVISIALPQHDAWASLTESEAAVAQAIARGQSDAEIARRRGTSPRTVARQAQSIYRKLGVSSRRELALTVAAGASPVTRRG
jgi:DNA-binding NarL/FixJ family response regulator